MRSSPPARPAPRWRPRSSGSAASRASTARRCRAHLVTATGPIMLLDVGANVDSDAENLVHFAVMGAIFAEHVLKVPHPRIGLLNIGEEIEKGDALAREAHGRCWPRRPQLRRERRGHDMVAHVADVVVCDGFVGNVVIKFFEGLTSYIFRVAARGPAAGPVAPIALLALKPGFDRLKAPLRLRALRRGAAAGRAGREHRHPWPRRATMMEHAMRVASESAEARIPGSDRRVEPRAPGPGPPRRAAARIAARLHRERDREPRPAPAAARARRARPGRVWLARRLAHAGAVRGRVPARTGGCGARAAGRREERAGDGAGACRDRSFDGVLEHRAELDAGSPPKRRSDPCP